MTSNLSAAGGKTPTVSTASLVCTLPSPHSNITYGISASWPGDNNYSASNPNPTTGSVQG
jgi:hypothetical protein